MTFKDLLKQDLDETFFNPDEFGEEVSYNGSTITVVEVTGGTEQTSIPGMENPVRSLLVREEDVARPKAGDTVILDGATWYVQSSPSLDGGVWSITVSKRVEKVSV